MPEIIMLPGKLGSSGGIESFTLQFGLEMARKGVDLSILIASRDYAEGSKARLREAGVRISEYDCVAKGIRGKQGYVSLLLALATPRKPDVLYTNSQSRFAEIARLACWGGPLWIHHHHMDATPEILAALPRGYQRVLRKADIVITCSPGQRDAIDSVFGREGRTQFLPYLKAEGHPVSRVCGMGVCVIGFFGLLRVSKGVPILLNSSSWFAHNGFECRLNGPDVEGVLTNPLPPGIVMSGPYEDTAELDRRMHATDILALPSVGVEGVPLVMCEALSRGVPVVAFDGGGQRDFRGLHPGLAVVDAGDVAGFHAALLAMRERLADTEFRADVAAWYRSALGNHITLEWWNATLKGRVR